MSERRRVPSEPMRWARAIGVCGVSAVVLTGCGQTTPPTPAEVQQNIQYVELPNVLTPQGKPVKCVEYASGTTVISDSKSWFTLSCDFEGSAHFLPLGDTTSPTRETTPPPSMPVTPSSHS